MSNMTNYFCKDCGTLLTGNLCTRCDEIKTEKRTFQMPKREYNKKAKNNTKQTYTTQKTTTKAKKETMVNVKTESPTEKTSNSTTEDPFMLLVNANRLGIRPSDDILNKLKNFHFKPNDEKLLQELGDSAIKMDKKYLHLIKAGFLITVFKICRNENCKLALPEFDIPCAGHKFIKIPKWLVSDYK